jgi:hypothetical protein
MKRAIAAGLALALSTSGCKFAIDHPPLTVGVAGAALGFTTCKLESDDYAACGLAGAAAGAALAAVAMLALWLGGDGHTVLVEETQPVPEEEMPVRPRKPPPPLAPLSPAPVLAPAPAPAPPADAPVSPPSPPPPTPPTP